MVVTTRMSNYAPRGQTTLHNWHLWTHSLYRGSALINLRLKYSPSFILNTFLRCKISYHLVITVPYNLRPHICQPRLTYGNNKELLCFVRILPSWMWLIMRLLPLLGLRFWYFILRQEIPFGARDNASIASVQIAFNPESFSVSVNKSNESVDLSRIKGFRKKNTAELTIKLCSNLIYI